MTGSSIESSHPKTRDRNDGKVVVSCWTCRRRRVKCDGCTPACTKCVKFGRHCMGYGTKPIVWAGIASRGKMKDQTFDELHKAKRRKLNDTVENYTRGCIQSTPFESRASDVSTRHLSSVFHNSGNLNDGECPTRREEALRVASHQDAISDSPGRGTSPVRPVGLLKTLTDPVVQDFSNKSREYLWYCK